jgi:acyl-CoA dehydrogenase
MNFDFSFEQKQFKDQIHRVFEKAESLSQARAILEGKAQNYSASIWQELVGLGVSAIAIPEEHSGLGLSALELCVAAEEIGRALAPVPFLSSICICAEAIRLFGSEEQQGKWLPGLASGEIIGTWGLADKAAAVTRFAAGKLSGTKLPVLDGMVAQVMIVVIKNDDGTLRLGLSDLTQPEVDRQPVKTVDPTRPAAQIKFSGAAAELLPGDNGTGWKKLSERAAVFLAFEQLGAAESALQMACGYSRERKAFGRQIGSFQAVKHKLADMYTKIQLARCHCYYGAWAISTDAEEAPLAAAGARCSATDALDYAAQENIHVHGGMGVTWEADCQLFYRRARLNALLLGARYEWQDKLITALEQKLPEEK